MIYEDDVSSLLAKWKKRLSLFAFSSQYRDGVRDCMYELKSLRDKQFNEEIDAKEAFEQRLAEDAKLYEELEQMLNDKELC